MQYPFRDSIGCLVPLIFISILVNISAQYKVLSIENDELCSPVKTRKIKLGRGPKSGLVIDTSRLGDHLLPWHKNFYCVFKIDAGNSASNFFIPLINGRDKNGIFAVIQKIVFRKNETTGECIDFVQFTRSDGSTSRKFCGAQNAALSMDLLFVDTHSLSTASVAIGNSFDSNHGDLEVTIFVSKEPLTPHEEMSISIVFTLYKDCQKEHKDEQLQPCIENFPDKCIYKEFFEDNYINCPYPDCVDEGGCSNEENDMTNVRQFHGSKILIGTLSSFVLIFAITVCCIWTLRKHRLMCWAETFAHPSSTPPPTNVAPRVIELSDQSGMRSDIPPGNPIAATVPEEDKDLPPSYDSLFPSR